VLTVDIAKIMSNQVLSFTWSF